jgi:HSP20 family protein
MRLDEIRVGLSSLLETIADGWSHLRQAASSALTRFKPGTQTNLPEKAQIDDMFYIPSGTWSMLGGNVFEDEKRVVVQLEVPGLDKSDLAIEIQGSNLVVRGEKRFQREDTEGRYRVLQCAYGSFQRVVPLPAAVLSEQASASYLNGIVRVEMPKAEVSPPQKFEVKLD